VYSDKGKGHAMAMGTVHQRVNGSSVGGGYCSPRREIKGSKKKLKLLIPYKKELFECCV